MHISVGIDMKPETLKEDLTFLTTNKFCKDAPVGSLRLTCSAQDVGIIHPSQRLFRRWKRVEQGWECLGEQIGINGRLRQEPNSDG